VLTLFTGLVLACFGVLLESDLGSEPHVARLTLVLLVTLKSAITNTPTDIYKQTNKRMKVGYYLYILMDDEH
jgi:hypothetical protein